MRWRVRSGGNAHAMNDSEFADDCMMKLNLLGSTWTMSSYFFSNIDGYKFKLPAMKQLLGMARDKRKEDLDTKKALSKINLQQQQQQQQFYNDSEYDDEDYEPD